METTNELEALRLRNATLERLLADAEASNSELLEQFARREQIIQIADVGRQLHALTNDGRVLACGQDGRWHEFPALAVESPRPRVGLAQILENDRYTEGVA